MTPTLIGLVVALIGCALLVTGSTLGLLLFVLCCSALGGSAAALIPALGNVNIQPANLALGFLLLRCLIDASAGRASLGRAVVENRFLILFALYGFVGAWVLPRLFAGAIDVTPLRPIPGRSLFTTFPLAFSPQNITVSTYVMGTMIAGVCATVAARADRAAPVIARWGAGIGIVHAVLGVASVVLAGTPAAAFFQFFRNGFYAQVNQSFEGIVRMNGIFAEPAIYASYGFAWLVLMVELWLRGIAARWTGLSALALLAALMLSTASTAYVALAGYAALVIVRGLAAPGLVRPGRLVLIGVMGLVAVTAALVAVAVAPEIGDTVAGMLQRVTTDKLASASGQQRLFWAQQGIDAFVVSGGLGVGLGSFRSSSIATAILGAVGVPGTLAILLHLWCVLMPLRRTTYAVSSDERAMTGAALSWTAVAMLIPGLVAAPSPDPGLLWGVFAGAALALRAAPAAILLSPARFRGRADAVGELHPSSPYVA